MKYEIINPSDKCYISSENERVAKYSCLLIGNGKYGLKKAETQESVLSIYLFGISDEETLAEFGEPFEEFFEHYKKEIAECINTFEYAGERTSLNNIGLTAKHLYKAIMEQIDHPTEKVCTGERCPMQVGYDVKNCKDKDCIYRTETEKGGADNA